MKKLLLAALLVSGLGAQAQTTNPPTLKKPQQTKYDPQVYNVTNNYISMSVSYLDPAECAAGVEKDAQLNRWSAAQVAEEKAKIPEGGYLNASWARHATTRLGG
jgi:hypothetical protein